MTNENFGYSVAISGNKLVVGAPGSGNTTGGRVYTFTLNGGEWIADSQPLILPLLNPGDEFGAAVDIEGETLAVGAPKYDVSPSINNGAVFIFTRSGNSWSLQDTLINPVEDYTGDTRRTDEFGVALDLDANKIIVGAPNDRTGISSISGSATVFQMGNPWTHVGQKLIGSQAFGNFGGSVSISNDRVIVSCSTCNSNGTISFYHLTGLSWQPKLTNYTINGTASSFGKSVSLDGNWAVVGSPTSGTNNNGSAYLAFYDGSNWNVGTNPIKIGNSGDQVGHSVAINENTLVIGSSKSLRGIAFVFRNINGSWEEYTTTIINQKEFPSSQTDNFGYSVNLNGNKLVVGALTPGSVSVFQNLLPRPFDVNGNGQSDISIFRPSTGIWYWYNLMTLQAGQFSWGGNEDKIAPADYDGDGKTDYAVFRPSNASWYITKSSDNQVIIAQFGLSNDIPLPNDFDGDGKADIAVWRPSDRVWYWVDSSNSSFNAIPFGISGDIPVMADFDGDAKGDLAVFRPSNGTWNWRTIANPQIISFNWGESGDIPATGDYDVDGKTDYAVFRPSTGTWWITRSSNGSNFAVQYGANGDVPTPADYDCDGKTDVGIWRPSTGVWYIQKSSYNSQTMTYTECETSSNANIILQFGANGDTAVPAAFLP